MNGDPMDDAWLRPATPERVHLVGLGGAGVSGAARLLSAAGARVSGHDRAATPLLAGLAELGVEVSVGPSTAAALPADARLVVRSAAVPLDDPQVAAALARGIPVIKYAELLPRLAPPATTLAVAGTHGKTTTSWLLLHALAGAATGERAPGGLIGGTCRRLGTNAVVRGSRGAFVLEACEYDRSFLNLRPFAAAIGNLEADHMDCYPSFDDLVGAFSEFARRVDPAGALVLGREVPAALDGVGGAQVLRLGREFETVDVGHERGLYGFGIATRSERLAALVGQRYELAVPGAYNVENAAVALALAAVWAGRADEPQAPDELAGRLARGMAGCEGAARRFDSWGSVGDVELVHDYAHHPTELRVLLAAARERFPGRPLKLLFQPHQHSRTERFFEAFAEVLGAVDGGCLADVYGARRHADGAHFAGSAELAARAAELAARSAEPAARAAEPGARIEYGGPLDRAVVHFANALAPGDLALVVGAGDIEHVRHDLLQALALRAPRTRPAGTPHDAQGRR